MQVHIQHIIDLVNMKHMMVKIKIRTDENINT